MLKRSFSVVILILLVVQSLMIVTHATETLGGLQIIDLEYNGDSSGFEPETEIVYGYEDGSGGLVGGTNNSPYGGVQLYTDIKLYLLDIANRRLPDFLKGQTFIKFPGGRKGSPNDKMSVASNLINFKVNIDVTVYIAMNSRTLDQLAENGNPSPVAAYMQTMDENNNPVKIYGNGKIDNDDFYLFQKDYNAGDTVIISGNAATNTTCHFYIPIIIPRASAQEPGGIGGAAFYYSGSAEVYTVAGNEETEVEAQFDFDNETGEAVSAMLITAVYEGGLLQEVKLKEISIETGNSSVRNHPVSIPKTYADSYLIKSFVWDSLTTSQNPLDVTVAELK
ncbi:MAG: hypothetical protein M0R40_05880 [Firmicutes bacterium]|nr:hypothetical protein [Bacillota bacterium]